MVQFLNNQVDNLSKIPMALNFQSRYYFTTAYQFFQADYCLLNATFSSRLNKVSKCDL